MGLYSKVCIECGNTYESPSKVPCGICPDCESKQERFCNLCGQQISLDEYESNVDGYCEDCYEEEYELHYHDEDWEDYHTREDESDDTW